MRSMLCLLVTGLLWAAGGPGEDKFEVVALTLTEQNELRAAGQILEQKMADLASLQEAIRAAQKAKESVVEKIRTRVGAFGGSCKYVGWHESAIRRVRKVEIRGKYVLVTDAYESCWALSGAVTLK